MTTEHKLAIAVRALRDIENPIGKMRRDLAHGCELDGRMAISLAQDPHFLRDEAKSALETIGEWHENCN